LHFDYGFKVRPFFARLIEPVAARRVWLDEQGIDRQIVSTWPDIFGYGLTAASCIAWHRMLNDTLAAWCADNSDRFAWIGSVPLIQAQAAAEELERAGALGACGVIVSSNVENIHPGLSGPCHGPRNSLSPKLRTIPSTPRSASARC
jgi:aminocarboxymuconate-semialdehyde decarboxylase